MYSRARSSTRIELSASVKLSCEETLERNKKKPRDRGSNPLRPILQLSKPLKIHFCSIKYEQKNWHRNAWFFSWKNINLAWLTQTGGLFLESCFSWAVYDFLDDMKDIGNYSDLRKKYSYFLKRLERVGNEIFYKNYKLSRKMLLELINEDNYNLMSDLERYLNVFYKE